MGNAAMVNAVMGNVVMAKVHGWAMHNYGQYASLRQAVKCTSTKQRRGILSEPQACIAYLWYCGFACVPVVW